MLSMLALAACGDDGVDGPTACEVGPDIVSAATSRLISNQPRCTVDDECVAVWLTARCTGYELDLCPAIVHREAAPRWDAKQICRDIDRASVPSDIACTEQAACAETGPPVCRSGRCVGSIDP
ncbi:MAG: hypothetical protein RLZZ450_823 [Pseudomonadota bacterium]|jgi:hypothetical protein